MDKIHVWIIPFKLFTLAHGPIGLGRNATWVVLNIVHDFCSILKLNIAARVNYSLYMLKFQNV